MRPLWVRLSMTFGAVVLLLGMVILGLLVGVAQLRSVPLGLSPPTNLAELVGRIPRITFVASVLSIGIGIGGGVIVSRILTAPLSELAEAAEAVGEGDLQRRISGRGSAEIVAVAEAFNHMAASLAESQQQRSDLIADVAHELRTPLTVLQGNLRALLDGVYPLTQAEIARIYSQTRHLTRLVEDLHLLAQMEANQLAVDRQPIEPAEHIGRSAAIFEPMAREQGVALQVNVPGDLPPLEADPVRLQQVLGNLLANAIRHTPEGGTIRVEASATAETLRISVADTGEGIPPEQIARLFERFTRGDGSRTRATGGSGLGLAIVRAIVEAHGGTVTAFSKGLGHGATFIVRLPHS